MVYTTKQKRLITYLKEEMKTEHAIIMSPTNIYYYTGFYSDPHERFFALSVDAKNEKTILFLPSLDKSAAEGVAQADELVAVEDTDNPYEKFSETIGTQLQSYGCEKGFITLAQYEQLANYYPNADVYDIQPYIASERLKKSRDEIEHVKEAIKVAEQALAKTIENIESGMTELRIKTLLENEMMALGAEKIAFDTIVLSGKNSALPHGVPGDKKIENGDFLLFDFGATVNGYHSDLTRTFIVGKGTDEQKEIYETVREANEKAIEAVKAGLPLKNVDRAARDYIAAKDYGEFFTHRIGHGLGLEVHEEPSIHNENEQLMERGMLFTIEPGIYLKQLGGVRIEDDVYIDEEGEVEVLSSFGKEMTHISI